MFHVFIYLYLDLEGQCPVCEGCDTILEVHSRFRLIKSRLINATATALHVGFPSFLFPSRLCVYFVILDPCKKFVYFHQLPRVLYCTVSSINSTISTPQKI